MLAARNRFIPAGAGNRERPSQGPNTQQVHPRGCGEQSIAATIWAMVGGSSPRVRGTVCTEARNPLAAGSSPRVRGTEQAFIPAGHGDRFIPAGAGNRCWAVPCSGGPPVHPRGCGEQMGVGRAKRGRSGSSPRVRGTGREGHGQRISGRFIPAGAGNSSRSRGPLKRPAVHPRGCGEQSQGARAAAQADGSSPRVRGTAALSQRYGETVRFIPAGAGNSPCRWRLARHTPVHPRGCGEQPCRAGMVRSYLGSSPRVRGTVAKHDGRAEAARFIPAGAGNSCSSTCRQISAAVHPRGCGEQFKEDANPQTGRGSSPRVRGTDEFGKARGCW